MNKSLQPGRLVTLRGRDWVVQPSDTEDLLVVKPLDGTDEETTGIYLPLDIKSDEPQDATFPNPDVADLGDITTARLLYDAARLAFRNGSGPFRSMAKLSFRPRAYQIVPLVMALKQKIVRLLIADDVGVGKTVEAILVLREMMERGQVKRFAVICLPHLCEQWQQELHSKLGIEAVIIRSSTQARLDRMIQGDESVYDSYPYQIISIDYIKADSRRGVFIAQCPELVIVDEVHTCAKPAGAFRSQQQRYHLVRDLADRDERHLVLLTATPHSGKQEEFQSLLGLLHNKFETLDIPRASQKERQALAKHFVQRKRADVEKWMGENTPFPKRDSLEWSYGLSKSYKTIFNDILKFTRKYLASNKGNQPRKRVHHWSALLLLRGVMSSPRCGVKMLNSRLEKLGMDTADDFETQREDFPLNPDGDYEFGVETDIEPTQILARCDWTDYQRSQLRGFAKRLDALADPDNDLKLHDAAGILEGWVKEGFHPVVFCRYIETAHYVAEHLREELIARISGLDLQVVTSEDPDELRKQRIGKMAKDRPRLLVATDCLSEGINLQEQFTAVLHYDLPWNPNRLEQREGRVDRYGQRASVVKACLLYGGDNSIDGIVLDVLLRKVREIKRSTGISIPFPEDSESIIDTITQSLLLNPEREFKSVEEARQGLLFDPGTFPEVVKARENVTQKMNEAIKRGKISHDIFAQNTINAPEIETDLRNMDLAIGNPDAVKKFVIGALRNLLGVQVNEKKNGFGIVTCNLLAALDGLLPNGDEVKVSFESPTPLGYHYLGRNHRFVEQLCHVVMTNSIDREDKRAARAAVIRTREVEVKTTLILFRCRNVIKRDNDSHQIVAEEMLLRGWKNTYSNQERIDHDEAHSLLFAIRPSTNLSQEAVANVFENELNLIENMEEQFEVLAEEQSKRLVKAHERFSTLMAKKRYQVVYPVLPMDLMGIYVLLPENPK